MRFQFNVEQAKREKIYVKLALMSPSGGGKSYSALRLATGMAEEIEKQLGRPAKILLGNTEGSRGKYYANEFKYDIAPLVAPYNPEMYCDFIDYAVEHGYDILIIDSTSPEWEGEGGCLQLHAKAGGKYQDWSKVTPRHDKFIQKLADSPIHIIATMRGKDQYELDKDDNGKTSVKKLGVGAKQREGFEYEFTSTFLIDVRTHLAEAQKDNTHLFDSLPNTLLTEEHGAKIMQWANSGDGYTPVVRRSNPLAPEEPTVSDEVKGLISQIAEIIEDLKSAGVDRANIAEAIKKYHIVNGKPTPNYATITSYDTACAVIDALNLLK